MAATAAITTLFPEDIEKVLTFIQKLQAAPGEWSGLGAKLCNRCDRLRAYTCRT